MFKRIILKNHSRMTAEDNDSGPDLVKIAQDDKTPCGPASQRGILDYKITDWWDSDYTPPDYHTRDEFDLIFPKKDD